MLSDQFNKGLCKKASVKVQITDFSKSLNQFKKLKGLGRLIRKQRNPSVTEIRKKLETNRIKTFRTAYPYGLDDQIGMTTEKRKMNS